MLTVTKRTSVKYKSTHQMWAYYKNVRKLNLDDRQRPTTLDSTSTPPADDLNQVAAVTHVPDDPDSLETTQGARLPPTVDLTGRTIQHTVQSFWNTTGAARTSSEPADKLPPLVRTGTLLNHVQQIAEMKRLLASPPASPGLHES